MAKRHKDYELVVKAKAQAASGTYGDEYRAVISVICDCIGYIIKRNHAQLEAFSAPIQSEECEVLLRKHAIEKVFEKYSGKCALNTFVGLISRRKYIDIYRKFIKNSPQFVTLVDEIPIELFGEFNEKYDGISYRYFIQDNRPLEPLTILLRLEEIKMVYEALDVLTGEERKMIKLYFFEEKNLREISQQTSIKLSTVFNKLQSARKKLIKQLMPYFCGEKK